MTFKIGPIGSRDVTFGTRIDGSVEVRAPFQTQAERQALLEGDYFRDLQVAKRSGVEIGAYLDGHDNAGPRYLEAA